MKRSRWYEQAVAAIRPVLDGLPEGTTRKAARRLLTDAYPFAERIGWAYKQWCKAARDELDRFFGPVALKGEIAAPKFRVHPRIGVLCGWCNNATQIDGEPKRFRVVGCLACVGVRGRFDLLGHCVRERWRQWLVAARADPAPNVVAMVLADWLDEELGMVEEAAALRTHGLPDARHDRDAPVPAKSPLRFSRPTVLDLERSGP